MKKILSTSTFSVGSSSTSSAENTMSNPFVPTSTIDGLPVSTVSVDPSTTKLQKRSNGSSGVFKAAVVAVVCAAFAVYIV
ncbi:hypothetical protein WICPIJ_003275 [Wickerhamomyces pijperi]|uniref:Uncharacterized protein n=1 Tax=Wickerhamomyces pijperi TaxID=599730 RepID=A0A9P8TNV4_WICPI|nr:hypothetical protein WICPIJ_003275 [Wickerhamomyces pijperi]